jgi:hypothetical protein
LDRVIAVEGERYEVLRLLDSIRTQDEDELSPVALAGLGPSGDSRQAAIDFRNELLEKGWPDGRRVAEMAGAQLGKNPAQYAARLRTNGTLLGVWDAPGRTYRHPDFQFDPLGRLRPEVAELLKTLPGDDEDKGGWRRAFWLYSRHPQLDGKAPAEVFIDDTRRVIEVAQREFQGDRDAHW